jgi:hypothetical protein
VNTGPQTAVFPEARQFLRSRNQISPKKVASTSSTATTDLPAEKTEPEQGQRKAAAKKPDGFGSEALNSHRAQKAEELAICSKPMSGDLETESSHHPQFTQLNVA